ncbi:MAG: glycoside hydrolase family 3 protein [Hyphomicrobiaceae bacterium]|nr:glycoside hydrolase family 3 protein [Hyphomicrobiaceae bacterium]
MIAVSAVIIASLAIPTLPFSAMDAEAKSAKRQAKSKSKQRSIEAALERARRRTIPAKAAKAVKPDGNTSAPNAAPGAAGDSAAIPSPQTAAGAKAAEEALEPQLPLPEMRAAVLATPHGELARIGRHIIVGYHNAAQLFPLIERGAIGGVFVTARNARGRTKSALAAEIARFRARAAAAGQKPFWITTDQEGGSVSRLSPPLPRQPSLGRLLAATPAPEARGPAIADFAARQAGALAEIGVNLNFAPVADLNLDAKGARDRHTRVRHRALSSDPVLVAEAARIYCEALLSHSVACTLKHFPGLGRVIADTHLTPATLKTPHEVLATTDWVPFRHVIDAVPAAVMIGHPHLASVDSEARPASTSPAVIGGIVREGFGFDGVVVTDDLAMGAIKKRKGGMARAAVEAIGAGADLVLLGLDGDHVYGVLYALLDAVRSGEISKEKLETSKKRLHRLKNSMDSAALAGSNSAPAQTPQALDSVSPERGKPSETSKTVQR